VTAVRPAPPLGTVTKGHLYDVGDPAYGAKSDLARQWNCATTSGSPVISISPHTGFTSLDVGKLVLVIGAGATVANNTNGAMSTSVTKDANVLTGSGFTRACVGRRVKVVGAGGGGSDLISKVWGLIDSTHVRLLDKCSTTVTSATWVISEDLYGTCTAQASSTCTIDVNASQTTSGSEIWLGTDDSAAINNAITAAITAATDGWSVRLRGAHALGTGIHMRPSGSFAGGPGRLEGVGSPGYSAQLSHGTTRLKTMKPGLVAVSVAGINDYAGVRGSITSGSHTFTDPDANFPSGSTLVGKNIIILGAGAQFASTTLMPLITTITSRDSATQLTLTDTAGATVTSAVYSYGNGVGSALGGDTYANFHIEGSAAQKCGMAILNCGGTVLDLVTISDFRAGVGLLSSGAAGWNANMEFRALNITDSYIGMACVDTSIVCTGFTNIDGNSNLVSVVPGEGTIGLMGAQFGLNASPSFNIQAVSTWCQVDGNSRVQIDGARSEGVPNGYVFNGFGDLGNGSFGLDGSRVRCESWSVSNLGLGAQAKGFTITGAPKDFAIDPGFFLQSEYDMVGGVDAASLNLLKSAVPQSVVKAGIVSDADFPGSFALPGASGVDTLHNLRFVRMRDGSWAYNQLSTSLAARVSQLGWDEQYLTSTVSTITIPAGGVAAGRFVIVPVTIDGVASSPTITVTDSKSNTYAVDTQANQNAGSQKLHTAVASAKVTTPLVQGDTITITSGTSADGMNTVAFQYAGLATASWKDQTNNGSGTAGTALSSGNITTTQNVETAIAVHAMGDGAGANGTLSLAAGWEQIYSESHQGGILMTVAEKVVFTTGTFAATGTASKNQDWASCIVSYKAA